MFDDHLFIMMMMMMMMTRLFDPLRGVSGLAIPVGIDHSRSSYHCCLEGMMVELSSRPAGKLGGCILDGDDEEE